MGNKQRYRVTVESADSGTLYYVKVRRADDTLVLGDDGPWPYEIARERAGRLRDYLSLSSTEYEPGASEAIVNESVSAVHTVDARSGVFIARTNEETGDLDHLFVPDREIGGLISLLAARRREHDASLPPMTTHERQVGG